MQPRVNNPRIAAYLLYIQLQKPNDEMPLMYQAFINNPSLIPTFINYFEDSSQKIKDNYPHLVHQLKDISDQLKEKLVY